MLPKFVELKPKVSVPAVASGAEQAAEHQADASTRCSAQGRVGTHDDDNQRTHHHADEDGDQ